MQAQGKNVITIFFTIIYTLFITLWYYSIIAFQNYKININKTHHGF